MATDRENRVAGTDQYEFAPQSPLFYTYHSFSPFFRFAGSLLSLLNFEGETPLRFTTLGTHT